MSLGTEKFFAQIPQIDVSEGTEMLRDFSSEAQRHLTSARNSLLVLETIPSDGEAIENVFKTFHTIKGLADFLNLKDIGKLTHEAETMLDLARKEALHFDGEIVRLSTRAIESLQKLLELLDEQIAGDGHFKSPYLDVGNLIGEIQTVISHKSQTPAAVKKPGTRLPTIRFQPDMSTCTQVESSIKDKSGMVPVDASLIRKLIADYQNTGQELKEMQSKLQERRRELILERESALKLTKQAQTEARTKSEYLASMSHEIRTLINAILGFTEILKEGSLSDKHKEHLNTIILSGKMLLGIVNDILDFSKVEAGKLKLESIDFNLEQILEEVFKITRTRLQSKPVNLYCDIKSDVPRNLVGDPTRLKQIFINLLDNAIKFTEKGEIGVTVGIDGASKFLGNQASLRFVVCDSGIGIPEDRKTSVFESFTQADVSTTRLYGGSGLGLSLCKSFVEKMGGQLWVESIASKGSQFIFGIKFPLGRLDPKSGIPEVPASVVGKDVMITEGHGVCAQGLKDVCEKYRLVPLPLTQSAKQASELLLRREEERKALPAVAFIDIMLPNKEGFMLAYKIRQQERYGGIKLVAVSSDLKADTSPDFRQAGFDSFLAKPILKSEVGELLTKMLGDGGEGNRFISEDVLQKISCEGIRILVVEDSAPNQELLKIHLESLGCVCDYAFNGQEAIDALKKNSYDMCFMDLQMPVMGGIEATRKIRTELKNNIPIVALTAAEIEEEKSRCRDAGMTDYLAKPFGIDDLKAKIIRITKM